MRRDSQAVRQWSAKPSRPVRLRFVPPLFLKRNKNFFENFLKSHLKDSEIVFNYASHSTRVFNTKNKKFFEN